MSYRDVSLWFDQLPEPLAPRRPLGGDLDVDVAVVGAGFTGLWTAYYLRAAEPDLRIAVLEREIAGFGASGRNGGWCSALFPVGATTLAREAGRDAALAQYAAMRASLDEVIRVTEAEHIEADVERGGTVVLARNNAQLARARTEVGESDEFGLGTVLLDTETARERVAATGVLGATYTPHCAVVQPAKLVRGLAATVAEKDVAVYEHTAVRALEPHTVRTASATVRAQYVVRATEGYTATLAGERRSIAPVYSLIIATEPLPDAVWDDIGLRHRETFGDHRHLIVPLGIARDWHPSVGLEPATGLAWAGGYVGDGVSTANLAGRTLADLVLGRDTAAGERAAGEADTHGGLASSPTALTRLPWVGHRSRRWEPEPLRWLGANAGLRAMTWADAAERRGSRPSRLASVTRAMIGQ